MLLIVVVLVTLIAIAVGRRLRVPGGVDPAQLGRMSEQWLAEYRASHAW